MKFGAPVLLVGNGPLDAETIELARPFAKTVVAADGGANTAMRHGLPLEAIIGDLDSITSENLQKNHGKTIHDPAQDTTDFEKCLEIIKAPLILGVGFLGGRLDHELAALNALVQAPHKVVLLGETDIVFRLPKHFDISLPLGTRISFFPMGAVSGVKSAGLEWELDGLQLAPDGKISSSNRVVAPLLQVQNPDQPLLCLLPRAYLAVTLKAIRV